MCMVWYGKKKKEIAENPCNDLLHKRKVKVS